MKDYYDFPPFKYFLRVVKSCPKSAYLYIQIWQKRGKHKMVYAEKKHIRKEFLISPTMFRNLLIDLMKLGILKFVESDEEYEIDVLGSGQND